MLRKGSWVKGIGVFVDVLNDGAATQLGVTGHR